MPVESLLNGCFHLGLIANVAGHAFALTAFATYFLDRGLHCLWIHVGDQYLCAFASKAYRNGFPDPMGGADNQCDLILKTRPSVGRTTFHPLDSFSTQTICNSLSSL
jgi:hypothetical protein